MITLYHADNQTIELPEKLAIVSDPPYGVRNNCDYTRLKGKIPSRNYKPVAGDNEPFNPARWLSYKHVALWGYQHFAQQLPAGTVLVWLKKRESNLGKMLSDCELCWLNRGCGCWLNHHVWSGFDRASERGQKALHPTQKPVAVQRWVIERLKVPEGYTICDPYAGSGSTLLAADELGFDAIGIELEREYADITAQRLEQAGVAFTYENGSEITT